MIIKILGTGCAKCKQLEDNVKKVIENKGIDASIEKVTDIKDIMTYGVLMTPCLVVDEEVKSAGKVLSREDIEKIILNK